MYYVRFTQSGLLNEIVKLSQTKLSINYMYYTANIFSETL